MPYSSNSDLPESVKSRYSSNCQSVYRHTFNSVLDDTGDEGKAAAAGHSRAKKCQGSKAMTMTTFKIFAPMLKTSLGADGKKRLHGVASSTIKDRHGDSMSFTALSDMERSAASNMTIFLNHSYNVPEDVAGTVETARINSSFQDPDIHDLMLDIVVNESNDRAVKTWEAINGGTKLGLSIGAMIPDGGATRDRKSGAYQIDHVELLETSLVGVPANPRSWVEYAVKSLTSKGSNLDELFDYEGDKDPKPNPVDDTIGAEDQARLDSGAVGHQTKEPEKKPKAEPKAEPGVPDDISAEDRARLEQQKSAEKQPTGADKPIARDKDGDVPVDEANPEGDARIEGEDADRREVEEKTPQEPEGNVWSTSNTSNKATVSITTPYADINIDTGNRGKPTGDGSSQEALDSAPENEDEAKAKAPTNPWSAIGLGESETDLAAALQMLEPTVVASLTNSSQIVEEITRELVSTKAALTTVTEERDRAIEMANKAIKGTAEILEKLSATPVGRRAVIRETSDKLASVSEVYGEDVLTLLKKG